MNGLCILLNWNFQLFFKFKFYFYKHLLLQGYIWIIKQCYNVIAYTCNLSMKYRYQRFREQCKYTYVYSMNSAKYKRETIKESWCMCVYFVKHFLCVCFQRWDSGEHWVGIQTWACIFIWSAMYPATDPIKIYGSKTLFVTYSVSTSITQHVWVLILQWYTAKTVRLFVFVFCITGWTKDLQGTC